MLLICQRQAWRLGVMASCGPERWAFGVKSQLRTLLGAGARPKVRKPAGDRPGWSWQGCRAGAGPPTLPQVGVGELEGTKLGTPEEVLRPTPAQCATRCGVVPSGGVRGCKGPTNLTPRRTLLGGEVGWARPGFGSASVRGGGVCLQGGIGGRGRRGRRQGGTLRDGLRESRRGRPVPGFLAAPRRPPGSGPPAGEARAPLVASRVPRSPDGWRLTQGQRSRRVCALPGPCALPGWGAPGPRAGRPSSAPPQPAAGRGPFSADSEWFAVARVATVTAPAEEHVGLSLTVPVPSGPEHARFRPGTQRRGCSATA